VELHFKILIFNPHHVLFSFLDGYNLPLEILSFVFQCVVIFSFSALTLLVGGLQQDRLACEKLGVGLFVVTI